MDDWEGVWLTFFFFNYYYSRKALLISGGRVSLFSYSFLSSVVILCVWMVLNETIRREGVDGLVSCTRLCLISLVFCRLYALLVRNEPLSLVWRSALSSFSHIVLVRSNQ